MISRFKLFLVPALIIACLLTIAALQETDIRLHVYFIDCGQGDAVLIRTPSHRTILIDGGPDTITEDFGKQMPFWDRQIDLVVLSHPHNDHVTGLIEILRRYHVKNVLMPDMEYDESPNFQELEKLIKTKTVNRINAKTGYSFTFGEVVLEVLHPQEMYLNDSTDMDNNSIVLRLVYGNVSYLFTGDTGIETEELLLKRGYDLKSNVLKIAHHGSGGSSSTNFINAVNPVVAVISVGKDNTFGHPHPDTLNRLSSTRILRTDLNGTIEIATDGQGLWIKTER